MAEPQIQPHRITKPIQLLAVWMAGLIILVGSFLAAAQFLKSPEWLSPFLAVSAVALVPVFLGLLFLLQTKFRPQLQEDAYYSEWLASQKKVFKDFEPENLPDANSGTALAIASAGELERLRVARYEEYQGVFLVHSWRPSTREGQMADVVLQLRQHRQGPLSAGLVDHVEYALGPNFFRAPVVKRNRDECFRLEVSAYAPMLCLARVLLANGSNFVLERYVDFVPTSSQGRVVDPDEVLRKWKLPPGVVKPD
jgi:hypothetical protein